MDRHEKVVFIIKQLNLDASYRINRDADGFDFHSHQEYEIYLFHQGACRYIIDHHIYDLQPGDLLLMNGLTLHKANVEPTIDYIRSIIHFSPLIIQDVLEVLGSEYLLDPFRRDHHLLIRTGENELSKELEKWMEKLTQVLKQEESDTHDLHRQTEAKVLLIQILLVIDRLLKKKGLNHTKEKGIKAHHAETIASYIQENYEKPLTITSIARDLNFSPSYLANMFKEITGFTVMGYVMERRIIQAKYLLEMEPDLKVREIAERCGFTSTAHFSRVFHEKVGKTATEYRNERMQFRELYRLS